MESSQKTEFTEPSKAEASDSSSEMLASEPSSLPSESSAQSASIATPSIATPSIAPSSSLTPMDIPSESIQSREGTISTPDITLSDSSISTPSMSTSYGQSTEQQEQEYRQEQQQQKEQQQKEQQEQQEQQQKEQQQQQQEQQQEQQEQQQQEQQQQEQQEQQQPQEQQEQEQQQQQEQQQKEQQQQQQEQQPEGQPQEITPEELQELQERELSLRSKILNQPLPCQKKQTTPTTYIEKIQLKTPLTENEATISKQIKEQCSQAFLYFQPLVETSPLQVNTITDCEQPANPTDELIETKYKKTATTPLTQFLESHIATQKQKNKFIQLLVHTHLQLLHEIQTLQQLDPPIIHFHLTPETIQYNTIDGIPIITDFRLAFTKTTLENPEENKDLFPPYENIPSYPFEVFLLSKLDDSPLELTQIAEAFAKQTNLAVPTTTQYETTPKEKAIAHHLTWDPYAVHQYIYTFMTSHQIPVDKPFMTQYKDLLVSYLTVDPGQRPSIQTTQENIKNIFKSVPKKDYLGFLTSLS